MKVSLSRRDFLKCIPLSAAAMCRPALPASRTDCRKWKLGSSVQLSEKSSADQFLQLKRAGIDTVELSLRGVDRQLAARALQWAGEAGIELWSGHVPYARDLDPSSPSEQERLEVVRRLSELFDLWAPLKLKKLNIHASYEITKPIPLSDRKTRIAAARKSLRALADKAESINAQLAVECLPRACLGNTSGEMLVILDGVESAGVTLDTNHIFQETHEEFIRRMGPRIVNTHVADNDGVDERHWLPGKGVIDFIPIIRALQDVGYPGPFNFECAGTPEEKAAVWRKLKDSAAPVR